MGREIRMVPPNYQHPQVWRSYGQIGYQPMFNRGYSEAVDEYRTEFARWRISECPAKCEDPVAEFEAYYGPAPKPEYYRTYRLEDATWYQLWETVSEGTPVTPPFATKDELVDYLVAHGDFWDQERRRKGVISVPVGPWKREEAESLVFGSGWRPTLMVMVDPSKPSS